MASSRMGNAQKHRVSTDSSMCQAVLSSVKCLGVIFVFVCFADDESTEEFQQNNSVLRLSSAGFQFPVFLSFARANAAQV